MASNKDDHRVGKFPPGVVIQQYAVVHIPHGPHEEIAAKMTATLNEHDLTTLHNVLYGPNGIGLTYSYPRVVAPSNEGEPLD